eukprot:CAMPEP_0171326238 /NCGR_PEP_ID=MMETSP0816-20121228/117322_1 /TAXON_ID=420281 /ORGANISM="Proboscia inermis, Strain CCAP1064/1" /LENGTH=55 /DNA_ID=CAMNT_0011825643 /DNA_START=1221 /DNA_END=1388 /DNA_ORIENTATION=+
MDRGRSKIVRYGDDQRKRRGERWGSLDMTWEADDAGRIIDGADDLKDGERLWHEF